MRKIFFSIIVLAFFLVWFLIMARLLVGGGEDTWICEDGQWIMHGAPSRPMPTDDCVK